MNKNDFRNPLIQSGIVLLVVFILISIVANSGSGGIIGSLAALVSALFSGILFIIALVIGILISIAILIGIYIAAISFQSSAKGREVFDQVFGSVKSFYHKITGAVSEKRAQRAASKTVSATTDSQTTSDPVQSNEMTKLSENLQALEISIQKIQTSQTAAAGELDRIKEAIEGKPDDEFGESIAALNEAQKSVNTTLEELKNQQQADTGRISDLENSYNNTCEKLQAEIQKLQQKTSVPEIVSGILSYIDLTEDRDLITEKAEEAISRGMTYNQIDDFFKSSLDSKVYKVLTDHPRLTKDFLRSVKKKFS